MLRTIIVLGTAALAFATPIPATACEITYLLSGQSEATTVTNKWDGDTYSTYLVRNAKRDAHGFLHNWIKFELIPQRWGFDLVLPNGRRIGQVNNEAGRWVVAENPVSIETCSDSYVTLKKLSVSKMGVYDHSKLIGEIVDFPFDELFMEK